MRSMNTRTELLAEIDKFINSNPNVSATRIGLEVANDGHLVHRLRAGRDITITTADAIRNYIAEKSKDQSHTAA